MQLPLGVKGLIKWLINYDVLKSKAHYLNSAELVPMMTNHASTFSGLCSI